jgi:hypothetical protein
MDIILNKTALDLVVFTAVGYAIGMGAGIMFRNSRFISIGTIAYIGAGVGGGYAFN